MRRNEKIAALAAILGMTAAAAGHAAFAAQPATPANEKPKIIPALPMAPKRDTAADMVGITRQPTPTATHLMLDPTALSPENVRKKGLKYMPVGIALSTERPVGITKEPAYKGTVRYGVVRVGDGPNAAHILAVDDPDGGGGRLYIDGNRNGDLTDDGDGAWAGETARDGIVSYGATNRRLRASWGTAAKEISAGPYSLNFYYRQGSDRLFFYRGAARVGTIAVDGKPYRVLLIENGSDGLFRPTASESGAPPARPVWLQLTPMDGKAADAKIATVGTPFVLEGAIYEATASADGSRLALGPASKPLPVAARPLPPAPPILAAGAKAPDFTADLPGGGTITLASHTGKVVILDFWATWCGPCMASMPHLEALYQKLKARDDVAVLAVCVSDDRSAFDKWVGTNIGSKYTFPVAFDPAGRDGAKGISRSKFGVTGIPTTFVLSKDGTVIASIVGYSGAKDRRLEEALRKAGIPVEDVQSASSR